MSQYVTMTNTTIIHTKPHSTEKSHKLGFTAELCTLYRAFTK